MLQSTLQIQCSYFIHDWLSLSLKVPLVLRCCSEFVETHGIVDGIYRLSGVSSNIQKLRYAVQVPFSLITLWPPLCSDLVFVFFLPILEESLRATGVLIWTRMSFCRTSTASVRCARLISGSCPTHCSHTSCTTSLLWVAPACHSTLCLTPHLQYSGVAEWTCRMNEWRLCFKDVTKQKHTWKHWNPLLRFKWNSVPLKIYRIIK